MKEIALSIVKFYFTIISRIFPDLAANQALDLFQKPSKREYKPNEIDFYNKAKHFKIDYREEQLDAYEIGSEYLKLVFLVHGWGSNLGRLSKIAFRLEKEGFRVVGINFPAHGNSNLKKTNLAFSKDALVKLIETINPQDSFSLVSHSFGSGVSALTLKEMGLKVDNLVFLTSANQMKDIFLDYQQMINLSDRAFKKMLNISEELVNINFMTLKVEDILKDVDYKKLLLVHDKFDKMLPYAYSKEIAAVAKKSELMTLENKGHSGMLFEKEVIDKVVDFLK